MMKEGKIVPLETVLKVLNKALEKHSASGSILIDGFPREMQQATEFEKNVTIINTLSLILGLQSQGSLLL